MVDFVRKATKRSLLTMLRKADKITPRLLARLFEGVLFKDEYETFSAGGGIDHGGLGGLADDDHTQYLLADGSRGLTGDWDAGAHEIRAETLESDVATGTAPLTVASTTLVDNLNADTVDGVEAADMDYDFVSGNDGDTDVTGAELEELTDESITTLHSHALPATAGPIVLDSYVDLKSRAAKWDLHGGIASLDTGSALDTVPTNITVTAGIGKLLIVINAGTDVSGSITVTGTSVDRDTGAETAADTDTITVDALTTDATDTDAQSNNRWSFTGAYITSKWFKGSVTLSTADLTLTDVDTYQVAFEQVNDNESVTLNTADLTAFANNSNAWMYGYLYILEVTGDKCDVTRAGSLELPTADVSADVPYRIRRGNLDVSFDGTTDGFWAEVIPGPLNQNYWEDANIKFWFTIGAGETTTTGYTISGTITGSPPIEGVTVSLTGDAVDSTTTDADGYYEFLDVPNGSYTVTPTKTGYTFTPTSSAVTISNGDQTGKDFTGAIGAISLPFTIDFDTETTSATPSYCNAWTSRAAPTVELIGSTVEGHTKCLQFVKGSPPNVGAGAIDLGAAIGGYAAGAGIIATGGIRMQILEKRTDETKGRQTWYFADGNDEIAGASDNMCYFGEREENDPDTLRLLLKKATTSYDTGQDDQVGINNETGEAWRYTRFEFTVSTGLTCDVYDTSGSQQGTGHSVSWPAGGQTPVVQLPYLETSAGAGFKYEIAEIWIGDSGDAWPSM